MTREAAIQAAVRQRCTDCGGGDCRWPACDCGFLPDDVRAGFCAGEEFVRRAMVPALPDRFGHEWEPDGQSLMICRLCGELTGSMAAYLACAGSAAEPGSLEGGDDGE